MLSEVQSLKIDFAIVGGGVAGTYVAWRLANTPIETFETLTPRTGRPIVRVFEATQFVGGRLKTLRMPGLAFHAELGGMRYTSSHILLSNLIKMLPLRQKPFWFQDRLMYLRGRHLKIGKIPVGRCNTCGASVGLPYELNDGEIGDPVQLVKRAVTSALKDVRVDPEQMRGVADDAEAEIRQIQEVFCRLEENGTDLSRRMLTGRQWNIFKRYGTLQGRYLYQLGFWNLLQYYLSREAFLFVHDALGYESVFANWNAAEAIPWFLADFGVAYYTLEEGLVAVPRSLAVLFGEQKIMRDRLLTKVEGIREDDEIIFRLTFEDGGSVLARNLILAVGKEALKRINYGFGQQGGATGSEQDIKEFKQLLDTSVTAHPLFKLFLAYDFAWWTNALGWLPARATTDLPIRQIYYYPPETPAARAVIMASYSDEHYVDFWKPLKRRLGSPAHRRPQDKFDDKEEVVLKHRGISGPMLLKAHGQVSQLHPELRGSQSLPKPYAGIAMDWSDDPFYGGWHSWNPGTEAWKIISHLTRPFGGINLFVCGEAFSSEQGWVEGALKSAELVLKELKVPPPADWVDDTEYQRVGCSGYAEYVQS